jgi:hypothetical protein
MDKNLQIRNSTAELFNVQRPAITKQLKNRFEDREQDEESVSSILELTATDGKRYQKKHYNLDAIISVGYHVTLKKATQFRKWDMINYIKMILIN